MRRWLRENAGLLFFFGVIALMILGEFYMEQALNAECAANYARHGTLCG